MTRRFHAGVTLATLLTPALVLADDGAAIAEAPGQHAPGWTIVPSVVTGLESFHYKEDADAPGPDGKIAVIDKHDATLPTATLAVDVTGLDTHLFARALFTVTSGSMTYVGGTMDGTPITGPTTGVMSNAEAVIGGRAQIGAHLRIGGYAGIGHRTWDRNLKTVSATQGYDEQYAWSYLPVGAMVDYAASPRVALSLEVAVQVPPWHGNLHISQLAGVDDADLVLVPDDGGRVRLSGAYAITHALRAVAAIGYERNRNLAGPVQPATSMGVPITDGIGNTLYIHEPYSETMRLTLDIGAAYAF